MKNKRLFLKIIKPSRETNKLPLCWVYYLLSIGLSWTSPVHSHGAIMGDGRVHEPSIGSNGNPLIVEVGGGYIGINFTRESISRYRTDDFQAWIAERCKQAAVHVVSRIGHLPLGSGFFKVKLIGHFEYG